MPRLGIPLTDIKIRKSKAKEKNYALSDGKGLHLLIKTSGTKLWEFIYTSPTLHKRRKTSLGVYPDVTLEQVRTKRKELRELIYNRIDPLENKKELKQKEINDVNALFENVFYEWIESQKEQLADNTYHRKVRLFKNNVLLSFKDRKISSIKHPEIVNLLEKRYKTAPETASRLFNYFDNLWRYAAMKGYCDFNIISNIHKQTIIKPVEVKHFSKITDLDILKELINSIYTFDGHYSTKNALKFVLHLPLRAQNLIKLKWEHIDFDNKILKIPRALMKNKNKNLPDFTMPLTDEVINILEEQLYFTDGREYIFMSDSKPTHIHPETPNRALQRLDFNNEVKGRKQRLHSFRGTFRSLSETYEHIHMVSDKIQEIALDHHTKSKTVQAYNNKTAYLKQLNPLMKWWSQFIVKMIDKDIKK